MLAITHIPFVAAGLSVSLMLSGLAAAQSTTVTTRRLSAGLSKPLFCTMAPGDYNRLFVVEQDGRIKILRLGDNSVTTFLDINSLLATGGERGLLGLAFHPQYASNRKFYVNYTGTDAGALHIVEYQARAGLPEQANAASARPILTFTHPQSNHNGGWLGFGPDGYLYISTGDGGNAYDMGTGHTTDTGNAQDITNNLLGKILRIDVNQDSFPADSTRNYGIPPTNPFVGITGDDEIWAFGLRNPWRCSFDRQTGDLYIGDVGQGTREEIDFQPAGAAGGRNYGWRLREGTIETPMSGIGGPSPSGAIEPVYDYAHGAGPLQGNSVTGGYVYRGPIQPLRGIYFFADFRGRIWSFRMNGSTIQEFTDWTTALKPAVGTITNISSFGEDNWGNLYIIDYFDGEIYGLVQSRPAIQTVIRENLIAVLTQPPSRSRSAAKGNSN